MQEGRLGREPSGFDLTAEEQVRGQEPRKGTGSQRLESQTQEGLAGRQTQ